ncbi:TonB-dependent receptor [Stenotrophomonas maltophilia]|uniref:TonB-dependent receptor n=1 Tax=Stenotrophomonas maltophilia TaxID=40324 RepID=UPI0021CA8D58|nr:TonB-dependent receptor [Stenotrophomonas maltophilia]MCU1066671.1 TonB-dependent receptor [Stenotrophomonas maltophilia]MCU1076348.1 TonB-dependent receptor [Stenotrophomonas maltophilia]MCU1137591.1 TonB-dependent receptor [Stenotrophomonas maltophilia]
MSLKTNPLRNAIVIALAASCTTPAFAQSTGDTPTNLDRIEITGSRIRQASVETAQPVVALNRAEIEKKGYVNVADILQDIPAAGAPSMSRASSLTSSRDFGGMYVSLRNLGPERSLVLIDGRRMGVSAGGYSDLASIPSSIVERVEVLTDGASALYGSDAIAGVVNIITRKNFDGGEASVYVGQYGQGDGQKRAYSATFGKTFDRGWFSVGAERTKEDEVLGKDREFSRYTNGPRHPNDGLNGNTPWGSVTVGGRNLTVGPGGDPSKAGNFHAPDPADGANTKSNMSLLTGLERTSVFANGGFSITDNLRIVADALYSKRESTKHLAGYPYSVSAAQARNGSRAALSKDSTFNLWGQDALFAHRTEELPRGTENNLETKRASIGLEGSFETGSRYWDWNVNYMYNRNEGERIGTGSMYQPHVNLAVGPSFMDGNVARCGAPGAVIAGCVPWNPAAPMGYTGPGSLSNQDVQDYLFTRFVDKMQSTTKVASGNISGSLFTLPAGDILAAMGFEHRSEEASYTPDAMVQKGEIAGTSGQPTRGNYSLNEVYLELQVPLLADLPFARELSLDMAGRYSDYNNFGSTTNSKFGLKWKPIDSLLVRATYGTGFRAPTVDDLYGGTVSSRDSFTDPCDTSFGTAATSPAVAARCQALKVPANFRQLNSDGSVATKPGQQATTDFSSGSNPDLKPETAKTWTVGLVYSPDFVQGLDLSLDWWKIRIDNAIVGESATNILEQCYVQGSDAACGRFTRGSNGQVNALDRSLVNAGYRETAGYDINVRYRLPETAFGKFAVNWNTTYTDYLEQRNDSAATTPVEQRTGWAGDFRVRSTFNLDWQYGDLGIGWTARYYSSMKEKCSYMDECNMPGFNSSYTSASPTNKVGSNTFHDLQVRYSLPWDGTVSLGVNNVFNHQGPIMYSQPNSSFTYYGGFDIGRFMYMKYQQRF